MSQLVIASAVTVNKRSQMILVNKKFFELWNEEYRIEGWHKNKRRQDRDDSLHYKAVK